MSGSNFVKMTSVAASLLLSMSWWSPANTWGAVMSGVLPNKAHSGLQMWLDASQLSSSTIDVATWQDASSAAHHVGQTNPTLRPSYVAANAAFNAWPTVHFNGTGDFLESLDSATSMGLTSAANRTVFVVFKQDSASNRTLFGYGVNGTQQIFDILIASSKVGGHFHGGSNDTLGVTSQPFTPGERIISTLRFNSGTIDVFQHDSSVNGLIGTKAQTLNTLNSNLLIGKGIFTSGYPAFNGDIAEILVYNEALSEIDRQAVDNYLFNKYSTTPQVWNLQFVPEPGTGSLSAMCVCFLLRRRRKLPAQG